MLLYEKYNKENLIYMIDGNKWNSDETLRF